MRGDEPLRIGIYVPSLMGGGAERAAAVLASGLHAEGHAVQLLVDHATNENRAFLDESISVAQLGASHFGSMRGLASFLREGRTDVVLAHGGAANLKLVAAQALSGTCVPIVLSYHGRSDVGRGKLGWAGFALAPVLSRRAAHTAVSYTHLTLPTIYSV